MNLWKKQVLENLPEVFSTRRTRVAQEEEEKRQLVEPDFQGISVQRHCELLGLARASYYYQNVGESADNLRLLNLLDEQYTATPFYGVRKMTAWLKLVKETE